MNSNKDALYGSNGIKKGSSHMKGTFTAVFQRSNKYWIAFVEEFPGVNTQGETLEEARENLREALALVIQTNRELTSKEIITENPIKEDLTISI